MKFRVMSSLREADLVEKMFFSAPDRVNRKSRSDGAPVAVGFNPRNCAENGNGHVVTCDRFKRRSATRMLQESHRGLKSTARGIQSLRDFVVKTSNNERRTLNIEIILGRVLDRFPSTFSVRCSLFDVPLS
jgi:hypothetical protein